MSFQLGGGGRTHVVGEVTERHDYGAPQGYAVGCTQLPPFTDTWLLEDTGPGYLYFGMMWVTGLNGVGIAIYPKIKIDGEVIAPYDSYADHNSFGRDTNTDPFKLMVYTDANSAAVGEYHYNPPLYFDSTLKLGFYNADNNDTYIGHLEYFYTTV